MGEIETARMKLNPQARIDVPLLVRSLKSSDETVAQNAGGMLGYYACHNEEHREAIAAQQENVIEPLVAHLGAKKTGLVHNAALLLGQCLMFSTEFRQAFAASDRRGPLALASALADADTGLVCNVTWAIRHFVADEKCSLATEVRELLQRSLPSLVAHNDARIQKHAASLASCLANRKACETMVRRDSSMQAIQALTSIRNDESLQAVEALTALATVCHDESVPRSPEQVGEESSPTGSQQSIALQSNSISPKKSPLKSPQKRRQSILAPWKKVMALEYTSIKRKYHAAVTHAAAG